MESAHEQVKRLVTEALEAMTSPDVPLSSILYRAVRIARLRGDAVNLAWLEHELRSTGDTGARDEIRREIADIAGLDGMSKISKVMLDRFIDERQLASTSDLDKNICGLGVAEIEARIDNFERVVEYGRIPEGNWHHQDLHAKWEESQKIADTLLEGICDFQMILGRIRHRVNEYLSRVEQELLFVDSGRDAFERTRRTVENRLQELAPDVLSQFVAAYRRQREGDVEARSQALTSCRRVLKTLADTLYPATGAEAVGADGTSRKMTDERFVSRLLQFVFEHSKASASRSLVSAQIEDIGKRLNAINDLASKGVHSDVTSVETDQCVLATYMVVADLLNVESAQIAAAPQRLREAVGSP